MTIFSTKAGAALLTLAIAASALPAAAATWSFTGPGAISLTQADDTTSFTYNVPSGSNGYGWHEWTATATADRTGTYTFDWDIGGIHAWFRAELELLTFGSTATALVDQGVSGWFSFSGEDLTFDVANGDTFGFSIRGRNFDSSQLLTGTLNVTDVSPSPVPLPASVFGLIAGLGALGVARRRQKT